MDHSFASFSLSVYQAKGNDVLSISVLCVLTQRRQRILIADEEKHIRSLEGRMGSMLHKCRSSSSMTLYPSYTNHEARPTSEKPTGLGIYTSPLLPSRRSNLHRVTIKDKYVFLSARPSLASLRNTTSLPSRPPSEPLPPLPAFFPRSATRAQPKSNLAVRTIRGEMSKQGAGLLPRINIERAIDMSVNPRYKDSRTGLSPAIDVRQNKALKRPTSSVYGRSLSGDGKDLRPALNHRNSSMSSVVTVRKSPLGTMWCADEGVQSVVV